MSCYFSLHLLTFDTEHGDIFKIYGLKYNLISKSMNESTSWSKIQAFPNWTNVYFVLKELICQEYK